MCQNSTTTTNPPETLGYLVFNSRTNRLVYSINGREKHYEREVCSNENAEMIASFYDHLLDLNLFEENADPIVKCDFTTLRLLWADYKEKQMFITKYNLTISPAEHLAQLPTAKNMRKVPAKSILDWLVMLSDRILQPKRLRVRFSVFR